MKDENIKERIKYFKHYVVDNLSLDAQDDFQKILDYITTLQKENERLKNREQECINHYLVQCKYASEMEGKYITANNIINELEKLITQYSKNEYYYKYDGKYLKSEIIGDIKNILQGDNNE